MKASKMKMREQLEQVEELVGELPEIPCDGEWHGQNLDIHDDGPATHYVQILHDCDGGRREGEVLALCERRTATVREVLAEGSFCCRSCRVEVEAKDWARVIGPVSK